MGKASLGDHLATLIRYSENGGGIFESCTLAVRIEPMCIAPSREDLFESRIRPVRRREPFLGRDCPALSLDDKCGLPGLFGFCSLSDDGAVLLRIACLPR